MPVGCAWATMIGSSRLFHTFTISASAWRTLMRIPESTLGRMALMVCTRVFFAFSRGARSMPRHCANTRWRGLDLGGPRGGLRRGGDSVTSFHRWDCYMSYIGKLARKEE